MGLSPIVALLTFGAGGPAHGDQQRQQLPGWRSLNPAVGGSNHADSAHTWIQPPLPSLRPCGAGGVASRQRRHCISADLQAAPTHAHHPKPTTDLNTSERSAGDGAHRMDRFVVRTTIDRPGRTTGGDTGGGGTPASAAPQASTGPPAKRARATEPAMVQQRIDDLRCVVRVDRVTALVTRLRHLAFGAAAADGDDVAPILATMAALQRTYITLQALRESRVGEVVYRLRGHANAEVAGLANALYTTWRTDAAEAIRREAKRAAAGGGGGGRARSEAGDDGSTSDDDDSGGAAGFQAMQRHDEDLGDEVERWDEVMARAQHRPRAGGGGSDARPLPSASSLVAAAGAAVASAAGSSLAAPVGGALAREPAVAAAAAAGAALSLNGGAPSLGSVGARSRSPLVGASLRADAPSQLGGSAAAPAATARSMASLGGGRHSPLAVDVAVTGHKRPRPGSVDGRGDGMSPIGAAVTSSAAAGSNAMGGPPIARMPSARPAAPAGVVRPAAALAPPPASSGRYGPLQLVSSSAGPGARRA